MLELWLIRHGETEWTLSGAHTGRTDLPLTARGRAEGEDLALRLAGQRFSAVLTSPLQRALETCRLAGLGDAAQIVPELREWDYGEYEGRTTAAIRAERPDWSLWEMGAPGGETAAQVAARALRVLELARAGGGKTALFGHGHMFRVLAACWLGLPPECGKLWRLDPASLSILGYERETPVIARWNT